ncbi:MAG: hypothetical protein ACI9KE_002513 [Polyangiales bacterium]
MHSLPDDVRVKLDSCGLELSDDEWNRLPKSARARLQELSADRRVAKHTYGAFVQWLRETFLNVSEEP